MIRIEVIDRGSITETRTFYQPLVCIGRDQTNDLVVGERYVSSRQGEIRLHAGSLVFQGRPTTNPTLVRRRGRLMPVDAQCDYQLQIENGDELLFGDEYQLVHLLVHINEDELFSMAAAYAASNDSILEIGQGALEEELVEVGIRLDVSVNGMVEELYSGFDRAALLALHRHAAGINTRDDERTLLANFSQAIYGLFRNVDHVSIYISTRNGQDLSPLYACDRIGETQAQPLSRTVCRRVLSQREAVTFTINETGFDLSESLKASGVRAGMCVPMWDGERLTGLVQVDRRGQIRHFFNRHDLEVLVVFTKQLVLALENVRLQTSLRETVRNLEATQSEMERLAFFDPLTGLSNRRLIRDRLQQAIKTAQRSHHSVALLYLDLDQFKRINDSLGHESGDRLLLAVANRLNACVRDQDTVARIGGDEFAVLLVGVNSAHGTRLVANNILETLRQPIQLPGGRVVVTTSIGVAISPNDGLDERALLRNADLAMYRAKKRGRDNCQFFTEEMNEEAGARLRVENELRRAMAENQFIQYFQPLVRLSDRRVVGLEALLRWNHPERGLLRPEAFIDVAEDTGLIVPLGKWVLENACHSVKALERAGIGGLRLSVNLSARQFMQANLPEQVSESLRSAGLDPRFLEIEITESMVMDHSSEIIERLNSLKALGVGLSIDDFGTGYSSLSYLKRFPIDTLKVDRSFVRDIPNDTNDVEISAAVIAMAHKLNMSVVAEGIETDEQLQFLRANSCDYGQGHLFSEPVPIARFLHYARCNIAAAEASGAPPADGDLH